jgi:hypothetical protein
MGSNKNHQGIPNASTKRAAVGNEMANNIN